MKRLNKLFGAFCIIVLTAAMLLTSFACREGGEDPIDEHSETGVYMARGGASDYSIVVSSVSAEQKDYLIFAAEEMVTFFREATGITLPVITDAGLTYSADNKHISLGNTSLLKGAGITVNYDVTHDDGYIVKTAGNTLFLAGGDATGTLYAVYDYLEAEFNLRIYTDDEFAIERKSSVPFRVTDRQYTPSFQLRSIGHYHYDNDPLLRRRLKLKLRNEGWIYTSHSTFLILPKATYQAEHPDWYSPDGTQICMTNEEMTEQFALNVIELYKKNPAAKYLMIGIEDYNTFCTCPDCAAEVTLYKESGVQTRFINKIDDRLKAWIDENQPGREYKLFGYAYFKTTDAPVKMEDGEYVALDPSVIPNENVGIMIAPLAYTYTKGSLWDTEHNAGIAAIIKGWQSILEDNLFFYFYGTNFGAYSIFYNDFGTVTENYRKSKEADSIGIFHLLTFNAEGSAFLELKGYLYSRLLFNVDEDLEALKDDFIDNYYKEAADPIREFFELQRMHGKIIERDLGYSGRPDNTYSATLYDTKYWSKSYLDSCMALFGEARANLLPLRETQPELYEKLLTRVIKEEISIRLLVLHLYRSRYSKAELTEMIDAFERDTERVGIYETCQLSPTGTKIAEYVAAWRAYAASM